MATLSRSDISIATSRTPETHLSDLTTCWATTLKLDLTSPYPEIASVVTEVLRRHENIDILVSVAGYLFEGSVEGTNEEETEHLSKTNLFGPINLARALLPHFRARRAGAITDVAGIGALPGAAAAGYYCASKAAVRVVTEALKAEVAAFGIEVCRVMLGHLRTSLLGQGHQLAVRGRIDEYEDVLGGIKRGFSAFHGRQPGDPVKGWECNCRSFGVGGGLGVPAVWPVGRDVFGKIEEGGARAMREVEGFKEVAGYTDLQGVGES